MWHTKEPSLATNDQFGQNLQPYISIADVSIWVKNSQVGWKTPNKLTTKQTSLSELLGTIGCLDAGAGQAVGSDPQKSGPGSKSCSAPFFSH